MSLKEDDDKDKDEGVSKIGNRKPRGRERLFARLQVWTTMTKRF